MKLLRLGMLSLAVLAAMLLQGCYPWGERQDLSAAYHGRLLDAETKLPVEGASVKLQSDSLKSSAKTGADGFFHLDPLREYRVGFMTLEGLRPQRDYSQNVYRDLYISRNGYQPIRRDITKIENNWGTMKMTTNGELELGNILLQPEHKN
jgi:hypothetical protein